MITLGRMGPRSRPGRAALVGCLLMGASVFATTAAAPQAVTRVVTFFGLEGRVPLDWTDFEPSSEMRLLQLSLPASGEDGGDVVVFFFGQGQGGDVDANVGRWRSQFSTPAGGPVEPTIEAFEVAGMPVTVAELTGTYRRGVGGANAAPVDDQTLVAAIVETGRGSLFIQMHGAASVVAAQRAAFDAFLRSLTPARR